MCLQVRELLESHHAQLTEEDLLLALRTAMTQACTQGRA